MGYDNKWWHYPTPKSLKCNYTITIKYYFTAILSNYYFWYKNVFIIAILRINVVYEVYPLNWIPVFGSIVWILMIYIRLCIFSVFDLTMTNTFISHFNHESTVWTHLGNFVTLATSYRSVWKMYLGRIFCQVPFFLKFSVLCHITQQYLDDYLEGFQNKIWGSGGKIVCIFKTLCGKM